MLRLYLFLLLNVLSLTSQHSFADEPISFKGIRFGMGAEEIAKLGGGDTKYGCANAIKNNASFAVYGGNKPWTYGGVDSWSAACIDASNTLGLSGLIYIRALVSSHNRVLAKRTGDTTYSVEELVDIFSKVFGNFDIKKKVVENGLGQEFVKSEATAIHRGAVMKIFDDLSGEDHEDYIHLQILSLDYWTKINEIEKKSAEDKAKDARDKLIDAKSDF